MDFELDPPRGFGPLRIGCMRDLAPDLLLAFWRPFAADDEPHEEQGYYFNSVLLARPGYYDTPDQAAARLGVDLHI